MLSAAAVKFWLLVAACLPGCETPELVRSDDDLPADRALLVFGVSMPGGTLPAHIAIGKDGAFSTELSEEEFVFKLDDAEGLRTDELHAFSAPAGCVRVAVTRIGDFWEFSGGKIEQTLQAEEGGAYYLGMLELAYSADAESSSMRIVDDRPPAAGTQPLAVDTTPPPSRSLLCLTKVIDDEAAARAFVRAHFASREGALADRSGKWQRALWGMLMLEKSTRPIPTERRQ